MLVKQFELRGRSQQRLVRMLAVHVDQLFAQFAQLRQRDGGAVDEGAAAAVRVYRAPEQEQFGIVAIQFVVDEPARDGGTGPELGRDIGPRRALAHHIGVAALTQGQQQRVDQDRLAGAGLAGQDGEARCELEFEFVDDHEVADRERDQHARTTG